MKKNIKMCIFFYKTVKYAIFTFIFSLFITSLFLIIYFSKLLFRYYFFYYFIYFFDKYLCSPQVIAFVITLCFYSFVFCFAFFSYKNALRITRTVVYWFLFKKKKQDNKKHK